jgi:hypothetical protein
VNWLSDNWKVLFDGVGGAALVALVGYALKRMRERNGEQPPSLNAQGSKVLDSPVSGGTGNVQRVNSPDYYFGAAPPVATPPVATPPVKVEPKPRKPQKRLTTGLTRVVPLSVNQDSVLCVDSKGGSPVILAQFMNEPDEAGQNEEVTAKVRIVYYDENGKEVGRVNDGCWLQERLNNKHFGYDESHELLLGTVFNGVFHSFVNKRSQENYYAEVDEGGDCVAIPDFQSGTVDVRLTNKYTGAVLNQSKYLVTANPLKATLQTT